MEVPLHVLLQLPKDAYYVVSSGRLVDVSTLTETDRFSVFIRLRGGKGGFGSLLRSFGSQFYKSTNQDACRDLSGRRIRDVNNEEKLKKWISKAAEREREKEKRKQERLEKLQQTPRHDFKDQEYFKAKQSILEKNEEALQEGMKAAIEADAAGSSNMATVVPTCSKRSVESSAKASRPKRQKKSEKAWMGVNVGDEDLSSSSGGSDEDDEVVGHQDVTFASSASSSVEPSRTSSSLGEETTLVPATNDSAACVTESTTTETAAASVVLETDSNQIDETRKVPLASTKEVENSGAVNPPSLFEEPAKEEVTDKQPSTTAMYVAAAAEQRKQFLEKLEAEHEPISLEKYSSAKELMTLGLDVLMLELKHRGLKCGGTLEERAKRLWSVKGLTMYPAALLAKKNKTV